MTTAMPDGWTLDTYDGHFAPCASNEARGMHLAVTIDVPDNMGYGSSSERGYVPVAVVEALIAAWREFMQDGAKPLTQVVGSGS